MDKLQQAHIIIDEAIKEYCPFHVFVLFSGGHDSLMTTHVTMSYLALAYPQLSRTVIHINTGIGLDPTRDFVYAMCQQQQWPLVEYKTPPQVYDLLVEKHGFPGPASHRYVYVLLKERRIKDLTRDYTTPEKKKQRMLMITGVRREESVRRMGHVEQIKREGRRVWVAPLIDWTKSDLLDYMQAHYLSRNEVVDILHLSGECFCGSFAKPEELEMLRIFYPEMAARIERLQERAKAAGVPCKWGERPPRWWTQLHQGQEYLPGFSPLCASCDARFEMH